LREFGGCLPLELKKLNTDFFPGFDYVALNSGRNAIAYAALAGGFKSCYFLTTLARQWRQDCRKLAWK